MLLHCTSSSLLSIGETRNLANLDDKVVNRGFNVQKALANTFFLKKIFYFISFYFIFGSCVKAVCVLNPCKYTQPTGQLQILCACWNDNPFVETSLSFNLQVWNYGFFYFYFYGVLFTLHGLIFQVKLFTLQDIEKERRKAENPEAMDEDIEDEVAEIKAAHFEESMKYARRSVSDADIRKYQAFAQTLQQSRGFGSEFRFSDARTTGASGSDPFATSAGGADDDDLYS